MNLRSACLRTVLTLWAVNTFAGSPPTFSLPDSVLLFGSYDELQISLPGRVETIKPPVEVKANGGYLAYPSISPRGNLIAWGFATQIEKVPQIACVLSLCYQAQFTLGVYSLSNKVWKTYGQFDDLGTASFSPDGSHIALDTGRVPSKNLLILDLGNGTLKEIPHPQLWYRTTLSWSPDSKSMVLIMTLPSKDNPLVSVLNLETGSVQSLDEGIGAAWSPTGNWIAYFDPLGERCLLVHPDGTELKTVTKLHQSLFSSKRFGWGGPVWSSDGKQLLVTEMNGGLSFDVVLVDIESGQTTTEKRDGLPVFGWTAHHRR